MGAALGTLRLSPRAFWSMTPRELSAALRATLGQVDAAPLSRPELDALMKRFPDRPARAWTEPSARR